MNVDHERKVQILSCAVEILRNQPLVEDELRGELSQIAERIENIARVLDGPN